MTGNQTPLETSLKNREPRSGQANGFHPLRYLASETVRRMIFPIYQRRQTPSAFRYLLELQGYEFASPETIQKLQWARILTLLRHAAKNVPYYRELFRNEHITVEEFRSVQDLARIPILSKGALQESSKYLLAENVGESGRQKNASGGSTGKPVQFFQDHFYWEYARASQWFVESWWGIRPGDRTASLWGCDRDLPQQTWKERLSQEICQIRTCNAFALTEQRLEAFARMLMTWRPRFVVGYASALELFSRFLLGRPDLRIRPLAAKSTAEVLTTAQKTLIETAFECPIYNFYGSREVNNLAAECPSRSGLHVNAPGRLIEIVDEHGEPVTAGVPGRILVTDLTNFAMPFIRYEIEDIGSWALKPCDCGRPLPLLAEVAGRSSDFITTPSGKIIHGEYFTHLFYELPQVARFQLIQKTVSEMEVKVVLKPGEENFPVSVLRSKMRDALGPDVNLDIKQVERIDRSASGKHRFTVSAVNAPWSRPNAEQVVRS
jgi:phenylacetate-CoA ligase